jgi:large subunit ribosomal protein L16
MGSGKGLVDHWVAVVKRGRILFEVEGIPEIVARDTFRLAASKLPLATRMISRKDEALG